MSEKVVPMLHVPDVRATIDWYNSIGFTVIDVGDDGDEAVWALLSFGSSELMFSAGGLPSTRERREVDLYVYSNNVDELFGRLKDRVEVVEGLHNTFYGMREFIIRDLNRFWMTFGQPVPQSQVSASKPLDGTDLKSEDLRLSRSGGWPDGPVGPAS